jgi:hypothetical protein
MRSCHVLTFEMRSDIRIIYIIHKIETNKRRIKKAITQFNDITTSNHFNRLLWVQLQKYVPSFRLVASFHDRRRRLLSKTTVGVKLFRREFSVVQLFHLGTLLFPTRSNVSVGVEKTHKAKMKHLYLQHKLHQ